MRGPTAFNRLMCLPGVSVTEVTFEADIVVVDVGLRRRRLVCPECSFSTAARYDTRPVFSRWRHTDMGRWKVLVRAGLRRLACPAHGVRVEQVPFARHRSGFSRDFEDLIAFISRSETLHAGEILGSGTVGGGCGLEAGKLLDVAVLDHVVIARNRYVSLKERGLGFSSM